ncbi:MAG: hypothetical protein KF744_16740 [Taibaiella sp.]|nr:hypothetical protein [Taibaiella sp.]
MSNSEKNGNVEVKHNMLSLRIFINGYLHLSLKVRELVGLQSWGTDDGLFKIEYITRTNRILAEYTDRNLWQRILKALEKVQEI